MCLSSDYCCCCLKIFLSPPECYLHLCDVSSGDNNLKWMALPTSVAFCLLLLPLLLCILCSYLTHSRLPSEWFENWKLIWKLRARWEFYFFLHERAGAGVKEGYDMINIWWKWIALITHTYTYILKTHVPFFLIQSEGVEGKMNGLFAYFMNSYGTWDMEGISEWVKKRRRKRLLLSILDVRID